MKKGSPLGGRYLPPTVAVWGIPSTQGEGWSQTKHTVRPFHFAICKNIEKETVPNKIVNPQLSCIYISIDSNVKTTLLTKSQNRRSFVDEWPHR